MTNINALIEGKREAQNVFYEQHKIAMFKLCRLYISDRQKAEDALQEGFVSIFKSISSYDIEKSSIQTWMRKIFTNTCLMQLRKEHSRVEIDISNCITQLHYTMEEVEISKLSLRDIYKLVHELPEGYRTVFILYYIEGLTHEEISKILEISKSTSKTQLFKSKKRLQDLILDNYPNRFDSYIKTAN